MVIDRPWSIQIELTEGCSRLCSFCGLNGIVAHRGKTPRFMTVETADRLSRMCADYIPDRRYEFAMHGEPTINPNYLEILEMFRSRLPKAQIQVTTNGYSMLLLGSSAIDAMFLAGIDFIVLDTYKPERDTLLSIVKDTNYTLITDCGKVSPYANHHRKVKNTIFIMDDLGEVSGQKRNRVIFNHGGNALSQPVPAQPLKAMCTNVFREISVAYDGDVSACCMDFGHELVVGSVIKQTLKEVWDGPEFLAIRRMLYAKQRHVTPCLRCNYPGGMRQGLIENPGPYTERDQDIVRTVFNRSITFTKRNNLKPEIREI